MPPCDLWGRGCPTSTGVSSSRTTAADKHRSTIPRAAACSRSRSSRMLRGGALKAAKRSAGATKREAEPSVRRFEPALRREARFVQQSQPLLAREPSRDLGADPLAARELQAAAEQP